MKSYIEVYYKVIEGITKGAYLHYGPYNIRTIKSLNTKLYRSYLKSLKGHLRTLNP
jgi:hypothetical protein